MKKTLTREQLDGFRKHCREHGLRVTPQRTAIYEVLRRSSNHPTAEQVFSGVKTQFPTVSLNTINETLLTFAKVGLVEIVEGFGSPRRYDPNLSAHHHVHCTVCGKILDFESKSFSRLKPPERVVREFEVITTKVVITGTCAACRKANKT